jgi:hypothetical protein
MVSHILIVVSFDDEATRQSSLEDNLRRQSGLNGVTDEAVPMPVQ